MSNTKKNEKQPIDAFVDFQDRWKKMSSDQKQETLLKMNLNLAYRLDILATVIEGLPGVDEAVGKLEKERKESEKKEKTDV